MANHPLLNRINWPKDTILNKSIMGIIMGNVIFMGM